MNKTIITGNITKDLELKRTQNGKSYLRFTIASRRDKENSDFINCVAWEKTAELIAQYHKKGDPIGVFGSIRTDSYDGQNGKVYTYDVLVNEILFMKQGERKQKAEQTNFLDAPRLDNFADCTIDVSPDDLPFF